MSSSVHNKHRVIMFGRHTASRETKTPRNRGRKKGPEKCNPCSSTRSADNGGKDAVQWAPKRSAPPPILTLAANDRFVFSSEVRGIPSWGSRKACLNSQAAGSWLGISRVMSELLRGLRLCPLNSPREGYTSRTIIVKIDRRRGMNWVWKHQHQPPGPQSKAEKRGAT